MLKELTTLFVLEFRENNVENKEKVGTIRKIKEYFIRIINGIKKDNTISNVDIINNNKEDGVIESDKNVNLVNGLIEKGEKNSAIPIIVMCLIILIPFITSSKKHNKK